MRARLTAIFAAQTRDHWQAHFAGSDACVVPVLDMDEAPRFAHNNHRHNFAQVDGIAQSAAAPKFSRTPAALPGSVALAPVPAVDILARWGIEKTPR